MLARRPSDNAAVLSIDFSAEGTRLFAKAIEGADSATFSLAPRGKAIEAQLEVVCRSAQEASIVTEQFQKVTALLRTIIEKDKQKPNPGDLSGVLTAGIFRQQDRLADRTRVPGKPGGEITG